MPTEPQSRPLVEVVADRVFTETILTRQQALAAVEIAFLSIEAAGFKIVPADPTPEMLSEADSAIPRFEADLDGHRVMGTDGALDCWRAMIAAAPTLHPEKK